MVVGGFLKSCQRLVFGPKNARIHVGTAGTTVVMTGQAFNRPKAEFCRKCGSKKKKKTGKIIKQMLQGGHRTIAPVLLAVAYSYPNLPQMTAKSSPSAILRNLTSIADYAVGEMWRTCKIRGSAL